MDIQFLKPVQLWALIILSARDAHAYEISWRIANDSFHTYVPDRSTVRAALKRLEREGYVVELEGVLGDASPYGRRPFAITKSGWARLRNEHWRMQCALNQAEKAIKLANSLEYLRSRL